MSKDCGNHKREILLRKLCSLLVLLVIIVLIVILIVYLVLRPTKPKFFLQDATVLQFNLSQPTPNLLSSQLQVTLSSHNPNARIGILYDRMDVYASYQWQQITLPARLPPIYQGHKDVDVWSPFITGFGIPIAPYLGQSLIQDESDGFFFLYVKVDGRIRWKVGSWTSGHYHLFVNCPAYLSFDRRSIGNGGGSSAMSSIKFQQISTCSVDV
ncbi:NDR1/HIN1-like protein 1 [Asparagus officinalis]|uniref:NDR1/HIN1-like protein 1 n=1 Tax=Asparagus officinalis TaxID=4686 RepID=UPI00098E2459|nr:NDR1/HIN1-like protein 1 [Asparagus officinalis]